MISIGMMAVVRLLHPTFTEICLRKLMGFVAVTPDVAAGSLVEWTDKLDLSKTGEYWAPRGPGELPKTLTCFAGLILGTGDIGTAEETIGKGLDTPLKLPW